MEAINVKNQYYFYTESLGEFDTKAPFFLDHKATVHQISQVLRMKTGSFIVLLDGKGKKRVCRILEIQKYGINLQQIHEILEPKSVNPISLAVGAVQREKLKQICSQGTQLGVDNIYILPTEYSKVSISSIKDKKTYLETIIKESLEQSTNSFLPRLIVVDRWEDFFKSVHNEPLYFFHCEKEAKIFNQVFEPLLKGVLCIGPEGGFSIKEHERFIKNQGKMVHLGQSILKTETACSVALGVAKTIIYSNLPKESSKVCSAIRAS